MRLNITNITKQMMHYCDKYNTNLLNKSRVFFNQWKNKGDANQYTEPSNKLLFFTFRFHDDKKKTQKTD